MNSLDNTSSSHRSSASNREISSRKDRIRKEITKLTDPDTLKELEEDREMTMELLDDAIQDGTIKTLRNAIKTAKLARLTDDDLETGGIWAVDRLRDAAIELKKAESKKRVVEAQRDMIAKRNKCFIRTEGLGKDRYQSSFIHFDHDLSNRVWAERDLVLSKNANTSNDQAVLLADPSKASICAPDEFGDFLSRDDRGQPSGDAFLSFARKEYHSSAELSTLSKHHWSCYTTDRSLRVLVKNLTGACHQEKELKEALKETLETMALSAGEKNSQDEDTPHDKNEPAEFLSSGDNTAFRSAKLNAMTDDVALLENLSSAIGRRVRLRRIPDPDRAPDFAQYTMGTVTGWKLEETMENSTAENQTNDEVAKAAAIWKLGLDDGGELHVPANELVDGVIRAIKWSTQRQGYIEHDAPFLSYRNGLGKFCGRPVEAPSSMTSLAFTKHMIKKEQDLYLQFKNRTLENNWGGKSGARNAWVSSLKDQGDCFDVAKNGLLTLEEAFFELSGGFGTPKPSNDDLFDSLTNEKTDIDAAPTNGESTTSNGTTNASGPGKLSGKDLLYDEVSRFDIELESLGTDVQGLWNTPDTREIFREIISSSITVSVLALGLDLISRNSNAYFNRTKSSVVFSSAAGTSDNSSNAFVGRRRAAMQRPGAYSDFF